MDSYLPLRSLFRRMAQTWKPWLAAAAAAGLTVLLVTLITLPTKNLANADVIFAYTGIESGLNPMGGRFDANEMKSTAVLTAAAAAAGLELDGEALETVQDAISITGTVPDTTFSMITEYSSIYEEYEGNKGITNLDSVRVRRYFPSQFTVEFRYADAGLTAAQGQMLLDAVLDCYQDYFYRFYGYNSAFEQALREFDYSSYDYADAVQVLDGNLTGLSSYLNWLSQQNSSRFVSTASGLSFDDLVAAIGTVRSENISALSSFITTNYLTKNREDLLTFYRYRVETLERSLFSSQTYLDTLDSRISMYTKDNALIMNTGSAGEAGSYEVSQPSETYNQLIQEKVDVQTRISDIQVEMSWYQKEISDIEALGQTEEQSALYDAIEEQFAVLDARINEILDMTRETATDYFRTEKLNRAFQVQESARSMPLLMRVVRGSLRPGVGVEAVLFGMYVLSAMWFVSKKRKQADAARTRNPEEGGPASAGA